ncbi:MAG: hypothetical protein IPM18_07645 [Phycisphaerales bacterium]|nr:hypothetical protein [Phycisphaerales bacterium]
MAMQNLTFILAWRGALLALCAGLVTLAAGCEHQAAADRRVRMRTDRLAATTERMARWEQRRSAKLAHAGAFIEFSLVRREQRFGRDLAEGERYWHEEFRNWEERAPLIEQKALDLIRAHPERIVPLAIYFI